MSKEFDSNGFIPSEDAESNHGEIAEPESKKDHRQEAIDGLSVGRKIAINPDGDIWQGTDARILEIDEEGITLEVEHPEDIWYRSRQAVDNGDRYRVKKDDFYLRFDWDNYSREDLERSVFVDPDVDIEDLSDADLAMLSVEQSISRLRDAGDEVEEEEDKFKNDIVTLMVDVYESDKK